MAIGYGPYLLCRIADILFDALLIYKPNKYYLIPNYFLSMKLSSCLIIVNKTLIILVMKAVLK